MHAGRMRPQLLARQQAQRIHSVAQRMHSAAHHIVLAERRHALVAVRPMVHAHCRPGLARELSQGLIQYSVSLAC